MYIPFNYGYAKGKKHLMQGILDLTQLGSSTEDSELVR